MTAANLPNGSVLTTSKPETGYRFPVRQANVSRSARGVVRGIHFAEVPPGQAKLVTCMSGSIRDVVVDIRVDSPTFGSWQAVDLSAASRDAVLLPVGVGHAFVALEGRHDRVLPSSPMSTPRTKNTGSTRWTPSWPSTLVLPNPSCFCRRKTNRRLR